MLHERSRSFEPAGRSIRTGQETTPIARQEQEGWRRCCAEGLVKERCLAMIRKLQSGEYRLYSRKINPKTGKRRNLGTFKSRAAAEKHERAVQYFKRH
ncbi:hypothetical protein [Bradyrhizobium sp. BWA-3-5]|nr:hypothetical protein [Bradyrhizobium sp. BWA-3-5]WOH70076.1 hypothetical protein RX331_21000 [Bradyrhizobium sp. BWA-3-5]